MVDINRHGDRECDHQPLIVLPRPASRKIEHSHDFVDAQPCGYHFMVGGLVWAAAVAAGVVGWNGRDLRRHHRHHEQT